MRWRLAILVLACMVIGCASGSVVLTGTKRSPIAPAEVKLFSTPPQKYEVIGIVKASSEMGLTEQGSMDFALKELKKQAAAIGANGILLRTVGIGGSETQSVAGDAIYVPDAD